MNVLPKGLVIASVQEGGIAQEMELVPGDRVLAVNEQELADIIDFQYLTAEEEFVLLVEKEDGELWEIDIFKSPGEFLGLEVEGVSDEGLKLCKNNCVFCFVAQMPKGMRKTLYCKDDDYRLSLTQGSFVTLSNLSEEEFQRIINLHLSPLYISVHAWNPEARVNLMKTARAAELPQQITRLVEAGISIHTQVVLVPGYNDGEVLAETVRELSKFYPAVESIAVVPVGLTKHRERLTPLRCFTRAEARSIITQGVEWQTDFRARFGKSLVYLSDEFYAVAEWDYPAAEVYDDFAQLENGVGMASKFSAEMEKAWLDLPAEIEASHFHMVTGTSAGPFFRQWAEKLARRVKGLTLTVHSVRNEFFGPTVTVAGLLTAQDIARQLGDLKGEQVLLPSVMLKANEEKFLDEHDIEWLEQEINGRIQVVENNGRAFLEQLIGQPLEVETVE